MGYKKNLGSIYLIVDNTGIKSVKDVLMDGKPITDRSALNAKAEEGIKIVHYNFSFRHTRFCSSLK